MKNVQEIRSQFKSLLKNNEFVIDKSGVKVLEILEIGLQAIQF